MTVNPLELLPPQAPDAEQAVLGAALLQPLEVIPKLRSLLSPGDFYSEAHRELWNALLEMQAASEPIDLVTVSEKLRRRDTLDLVGGQARLVYLLNCVPTAESAPRYAQIVREKSVLRELLAMSHNLQAAVCSDNGTPPLELISKARTRLDELGAIEPGADTHWTTFAEQKEPTWLWDRWLPVGGLGILVGESGLGKTWFGMSMAAAVATGQKLAGTFDVAAGPALYVDEEAGPGTMATRTNLIANGLRLPADAPLHLASLDGINLTEPLGLGRLESLIRQIRPVVVILDPWAAMIPGGDERSNRDVSAALAQIRRLRKLGPAFLLVCHFRKRTGFEQADAPLERLRGGAALRDASDCIILLRPAGENVLQVDQLKTRCEGKQASFRVRLEILAEQAVARLPFIEEVEEQREAETAWARAEQAVLERLAAEGPTKRTELIAVCLRRGIGERTGEKLIKSMEERGAIKALPHVPGAPRGKIYESAQAAEDLWDFGGSGEEERP